MFGALWWAETNAITWQEQDVKPNLSGVDPPTAGGQSWSVQRDACDYYFHAPVYSALVPNAVMSLVRSLHSRVNKATSTRTWVFLKSQLLLCVWVFRPHVNAVLDHWKQRCLKTQFLCLRADEENWDLVAQHQRCAPRHCLHEMISTMADRDTVAVNLTMCSFYTLT